MNDYIIKCINEGKYVQLVNASDRSITTLEKRISFKFDSSVCTTVYGWNKNICKDDVAGTIEYIYFPIGYAPELSIGGLSMKYQETLINKELRLKLVIADSQDLYNAYLWYKEHKYDIKPSDIIRTVYKWDRYDDKWHSEGTYRDTSLLSLIGLDNIFTEICTDISIVQTRRDVIDKLGMTPSLNYLLISKPGMGKTSLIRALATKYNIPMHVVDYKAMAGSSAGSIFAKTKNKDGLSLYLFEDFDRYLNTACEEQMASLLNALDGVENMPLSIRFFTSNSIIEGERIEAFMTRMRRKIIMPYHGYDAYKHSINIIYPSLSQDDQDKMIEEFKKKQLSMRVVNQILCASMSHKDPIHYIIDTIHNTVRMKPLQKIHVEKDNGCEVFNTIDK